jgi:hypothetical protein
MIQMPGIGLRIGTDVLLGLATGHASSSGT